MAKTGISRLWAALAAAGAVLILPLQAGAQDEAASAIRRYRDREASTGYYEQYEVRPRRMRPFVELPGVQGGVLPYRPSVIEPGARSRLADSHEGIPFYREKSCASCHPQQAQDIHTVRANLTCRQCHGGEPIAGINYYRSPMNPIRRHAYVCSKCHPGAGVSFAAYVVHEPRPSLASTLKTFPALAYAFWAMAAIAVGTFLLFIPHTFLWGLRELFVRKETPKRERDTQDQA